MSPNVASSFARLSEDLHAVESFLAVVKLKGKRPTKEEIENALKENIGFRGRELSGFIERIRTGLLKNSGSLLKGASALELLSLNPSDPDDTLSILEAAPWHIHLGVSYKIAVANGSPTEVAIGDHSFDLDRYEVNATIDAEFSAHIDALIAKGKMQLVRVPFLTWAELTPTTVHRRSMIPTDFPVGHKRLSARIEYDL